jgi:hypothetical protein
MAAGTFYAVNPFVFNRLFAGHIALLIGYALLPFAVAAALRSLSSPVLRWLVPSLWWAGLTSLSPHFAWIFGVVICSVAATALIMRQHPLRRIASWFVAVTGVFTLMSAYIYMPYSSTNLPTQVGAISLDLYRTTADPHLGLFANVLGLYGFWRIGPGPQLPKDVISGWPFLMLAILLIAAYGVWGTTRWANSGADQDLASDGSIGASTESVPARQIATPMDYRDKDSTRLSPRQLRFPLLIVAIAGYFLALGNQGPTGWLFSWAYNHVPFFSIMREPQKFLMLLALAYAVFFGWGVDRLRKLFGSSQRWAAATVAIVLALALPLGYTVTIFNGLAGQIKSSSLPPDYQRADALMGAGPGNVLALPWHIYLSYPFTNGRAVGNVLASSFRRSVISGDNVESGGVETQSTSPRSAYLQELFANGPQIHSFGELVAPLGVQFVVLAKTVDWPAYDWLTSQKNLKLVLNTSALEVWRNTAYGGVGQRVTTLSQVSSFTGLLALTGSNRLWGAVTTSNQTNTSGSTIQNSAGTTSRGVSTISPTVRQLSPVAYWIAAGTQAWVAVDAAYQRGWSLNGVSATQSAEGTVLIHVGVQSGILRFTPWGIVRLGYVISGVVIVMAMAVLWVTRRSETPVVNEVR